METPPSGYVTLRIRDRRYLGTWAALQNVIVPNRILRNVKAGFQIPVSHLIINGRPNRFPAVAFKRIASFCIIDTKLDIPAKPIRLFQAELTEISDNHLAALHSALIDHGCCHEQSGIEREQYFYHL
jgi:hypothetical protein